MKDRKSRKRKETKGNTKQMASKRKGRGMKQEERKGRK